MKNEALVVIDLQNDITKNYKTIIGQVNAAIDWAVANEMHIIYIKHYNLSEKTRTFKPETKGAELVPELNVVSENLFEKSKASALTSEAFAGFIEKNDIVEFYITGADATGCVKSTSYNLAKVGYKVHVISDCVTSYDLKKMDEMFKYYADKGCDVKKLGDYLAGANTKYPWIEDYLMKKTGVTKDLQAEWNWIRFQIGGKMFAAICLDDNDKPYYITLKLDPLEGDFWRKQYEDIIPGYYMNKLHWNSVKADGEVPDDILKDLLDKAYQIVLGSFSKKKQKEILGDE